MLVEEEEEEVVVVEGIPPNGGSIGFGRPLLSSAALPLPPKTPK